MAWSAVFIGVPIILAGLLAGPTRSATTLRRLMAPYLRDRPDISFGVLGLLLLLLFAWGPIVATRTLSGIAIIIVLAIFGTQMLRRQTATGVPRRPRGLDGRQTTVHAARAEHPLPRSQGQPRDAGQNLMFPHRTRRRSCLY